MNRYQVNQMKAAGFVPAPRFAETPDEWALRMIEQAKRRVLRIAPPFEIDWDAHERTRQHCLDTERE